MKITYAIKEDNRLKLVSLKSGNVEELLDITEAVGGYDNISPFSGLYGEKESMIFDNDNGFVIIKRILQMNQIMMIMEQLLQ